MKVNNPISFARLLACALRLASDAKRPRFYSGGNVFDYALQAVVGSGKVPRSIELKTTFCDVSTGLYCIELGEALDELTGLCFGYFVSPGFVNIDITLGKNTARELVEEFLPGIKLVEVAEFGRLLVVEHAKAVRSLNETLAKQGFSLVPSS